MPDWVARVARWGALRVGRPAGWRCDTRRIIPKKPRDTRVVETGGAINIRLEITAISGTSAGDELVVRAAIVNDSFAPVPLWRNAFSGPSLLDLGPGSPPEISVEATNNQADEPMTLQPFTLYGRDRVFVLAPGSHRFGAEYDPAGADPPLRLEVSIEVTDPSGAAP